MVGWRDSERKRLLAQRQAIEPEERARRDARLISNLDALLRRQPRTQRIISAYWPMRGEPDLRCWLKTRHQRGDPCALPVLVAMDAPLAFRQWSPGGRMIAGAWDTQIPADDLPVVPTVVIMPVVAFDRDCYRLGYGGGYFDRTLASMSPKPLCIGVGYAQFGLVSIEPHSLDVPMSFVVTEQGIIEPHRP
ncbi:MAG: 5-formyltetrahydrofolate cyclo-ligase [Steroidobacteraceae bacterium]